MHSQAVARREGGREGESGPRAPRAAALVSFAAALLPVLVACLIATPKYPMSPDEQIQQLYASGRFLAAGQSLLMPYSLVTISAPLSALYAVLPAVPWYALTLLALIVASFAVAWDKALRSRLSDGMCRVVLALLVALELISTMYLTFTIVAFLATAAGLMLVVGNAAFEKVGGVRAGDVFGCLLVVLGYSLRPESGLATIALFAPFAIWVLAKNRHVASIVRGVVVIALVGICALAARYAYDHTQGWEGYSAYLDAGRSALDYPDLSVEEVQAVEPSLSDNDVTILYNWLFADDSVFGTEFFERLGGAVDHLSLSNLVASLKAKTTYLLLGLVVVAGAFAWAIGKDIRCAGPARALMAGVVAMMLVSCLLLIMRQRVRLHVVLPLVMCAVFALITCAWAPEQRRGGHAAARGGALLGGRAAVAVPALALVLCLGVCGVFYLKVARPLAAQTSSATSAAARAYVDEHPDELVVFGRSQTIYFTGYNAFTLEGWDFPDNMLPIGGWENHTAPWAALLERWGIEDNDVLQELPERDDMVAVLQPAKMEMIQTYLSEHSGRKVQASIVEDLGPGATDPTVHVYVYKFSYAS